ncbi:hypothetical protein PTKIN_Ptkin06aG0004600 [Pterospermum kingtungense]
MLISPSHSSLDYGNIKNLSSAKNNDDDKVTLSLYYETLCPYSASFITDDLVKVFQNDLDTIVNLRLVPWGNAHIVDNRIHCQHGEKECYLNTIHSCVINLWPDVKTHFEFIRCTEEPPQDMGPVKTEEEPLKLWVPCSEKLKLNEDLIKECYISGRGNKLELQYANETANLHPPHVFVPWVVVNNQPIRDDFKNFVKYVCQAYKGGQLPKACKEQSSNVSSTNKKAKAIYPGCYAGGFRRHRNEIEP